jgi:hypothetical protein
MIIYVFGSPLVKEDSIPLRLIEVLKLKFPKINFKHVDPNENFPPHGEKDLTILDTVKGIDKVTLFGISDLEDIKTTPVSPHDYDLLFHLQLLKKLGKINSAKIIGIPQKSQKNLLEEIVLLIDQLLIKKQ